MPVTALAVVILLNGLPFEFGEVKPTLQDGVVMVPVRALMEKMGATVQFDAGMYDLYISWNGKKINLKSLQTWHASGKTINYDLYPRLLVKSLHQFHPIAVAKAPLRLLAEGEFRRSAAACGITDNRYRILPCQWSGCRGFAACCRGGGTTDEMVSQSKGSGTAQENKRRGITSTASTP